MNKIRTSVLNSMRDRLGFLSVLFTKQEGRGVDIEKIKT